MNCKEVFIHFVREILYRVASAYFFLGSILIPGSVHVHTDREKVSTKPLIILIKALNEGLSSVLL